jgi:hypothetical protein
MFFCILVSSIWPFSTWVVPVFLLEYCLITPRICCLLFKLSIDVLSMICRLHNLRSPFKIPFYLVPPLFSRFGHTHYFTWGPYAAFQNFTIFVFKCWILLKPVQRGVGSNLHFPVPSINRLNQTEPATFSILPCWTFFRESVFSIFLLLCIV